MADIIWMTLSVFFAIGCITFVAIGLGWYWAIIACIWTASATIRLAKIAVTVALEERQP